MKLLLVLLAACGSAAADTDRLTAEHLTARAVDWVEHTPRVGENAACTLSCHTTVAYLIARPALGVPPAGDAFYRIRGLVEDRVTAVRNFRTATSFYGAPGSTKEAESRATEAVLDAATLALGDRALGETRAITRLAFDRMWQMQRADGGFDWLDFGLQPFEAGGTYGATLAALTAGAMPADSRAAHRDDIARLVAHVRARRAALGVHERVALLRAAVALPGLLDADERAAIAGDLVRLRRRDGGWSLAGWLGDTTASSDAYATAIATLALCESGHRDDARAGLAWLTAHRNHDGAWQGTSVSSTSARNRLYASDAATAYAALAIATCR